MESRQSYNNLNFNLRRPKIPRHWLSTFIVLIVFTIVWKLLPPSVMYWLLFLAIGTVTWIASYGWRKTLMAAINFLHFLETS